MVKSGEEKKLLNLLRPCCINLLFSLGYSCWLSQRRSLLVRIYALSQLCTVVEWDAWGELCYGEQLCYAGMMSWAGDDVAVADDQLRHYAQRQRQQQLKPSFVVHQSSRVIHHVTQATRPPHLELSRASDVPSSRQDCNIRGQRCRFRGRGRLLPIKPLLHESTARSSALWR